MMATEQEVKMAAQLYEMRDKAKRLLGSSYAPHMAELGVVLARTAVRDKTSVLAVAIDVAKKRGLTGLELVFVMAAAVELSEPSNAASR